MKISVSSQITDRFIVSHGVWGGGINGEPNLLRETLSIDNPEIANYGDGTHHNHEKVQRKIESQTCKVK